MISISAFRLDRALRASDRPLLERVHFRQFNSLLFLATLASPCMSVRAATPSAASPTWIAELDPPAPGSHPSPRSMVAVYRFGWSSLEAAEATIRIRTEPGSLLVIDGQARTIGPARALWRMDAKYTTRLPSRSFRATGMELEERYRSKTVSTQLAFSPTAVTRTRVVAQSGKPTPTPKPKRFPLPNARDLVGALLYVRSHPLRTGERHTFVAFPSDSPYLARTKVTGRETISCNRAKRAAIRIDLDLRSIQSDQTLKPVGTFRSARAWLSDDADRLVLRVEGDIFIGAVFAELQSVKFTGDPPAASP